MPARRLFHFLFAIMMLFSLMFNASAPVVAQNPNPANGQALGRDKDKKPKITQADRQAAAERAADAGFTMEAMGEADMAMPGATPHYFSHPNYANNPLPGNVVADWNDIAQEILQPTPMDGMPMSMDGVSMSAAFVYLSYVANSPLPGNIVAEWNDIAQEILQPTPMDGMPMPMDGVPMFAAFVYLSYAQAAVYNALVAIEGGYTPYNSTLTADSSASQDAAVAAAAYGVLNAHFPSDALMAKYNASLSAIPDNLSKTAGIAVGQDAADEIIALRAGDVLSGDGGYVLPEPGPGVWEPTSPMPPTDPWMAKLRPFLRSLPEQYWPGPPPDLTSAEYAAELNEVKKIGGAMSMTRTPEQTEVAEFWTTNMVIRTNGAYRQLAAGRGLGLLDTARLMAMGNMAAVDSLIAVFDTKYEYNFWRPVTAIQRADTDGNPDTDPDPNWMPAVMTPNFPEYVSGHGAFESAQAEVYTQFFGTAQIEIDLASSVTGTTRHFATAEDMRIEVVNARTWGGLHFRNSSILAVGMGQQLVMDALASHFLSAPDLSTHDVVSGGIR